MSYQDQQRDGRNVNKIILGVLSHTRMTNHPPEVLELQIPLSLTIGYIGWSNGSWSVWRNPVSFLQSRRNSSLFRESHIETSFSFPNQPFQELASITDVPPGIHAKKTTKEEKNWIFLSLVLPCWTNEQDEEIPKECFMTEETEDLFISSS